jgi:hypothetical protein
LEQYSFIKVKEVPMELNTFSTMALDEGKLLIPYSGCPPLQCTLDESWSFPYSHPEYGDEGKTFHHSASNETRTNKPVNIHFSDCTIRALMLVGS